MVGISFRPDLNFDIFDALGLDPTYYNTTESDIHTAWIHVCNHLHPDRIQHNQPHVPEFPSFEQAQRAHKFLLNLDFSGSPYPNTIEVRIRIAISEVRADYQSTWNPFATPGTFAATRPIPGRTSIASSERMPTPSPTPSPSPSVSSSSPAKSLWSHGAQRPSIHVFEPTPSEADELSQSISQFSWPFGAQRPAHTFPSIGPSHIPQFGQPWNPAQYTGPAGSPIPVRRPRAETVGATPSLPKFPVPDPHTGYRPPYQPPLNEDEEMED
ncbi:hypothetical protein MMC17_005192 [Xylographa soralifera]|nr:hypothetical protein [Xylographa soralifera]